MADSNFYIKGGDGTFRPITYFMSAGDIKSTGVTFDNDSYYDSKDTAKYVIYRTPDMTNFFNYIWSDAHSIVGTYYRRAGQTQSPDFAKRGWAPTFSNGTSWTPTATTSQIKYVSGTGLQYRNSTSGSWSTLSSSINSPIVLIETQGAGGGGGGACVNKGNANTHSYSSGGGGASGGYLAHVFDLSDGAELTLVKGTGGAAGTNGSEASGTAGTRGGGSYIKKGGSIIVAAPGGPPGKAATHKTGTTVAAGRSDVSALSDFTYITGSSSTATTAYANEFCYSLGARGAAGVGPTESSKLSGSTGSTSDNIGTIFKRSGVGSAGAGGSSTTGMSKVACGGGGGGSVLGNGGTGHDCYSSGGNWYTNGSSGTKGGGGGGGAYGWTGSSHMSSPPSKGADGEIVVWYQYSYKEP